MTLHFCVSVVRVIVILISLYISAVFSVSLVQMAILL